MVSKYRYKKGKWGGDTQRKKKKKKGRNTKIVREEGRDTYLFYHTIIS